MKFHVTKSYPANTDAVIVHLTEDDRQFPSSTAALNRQLKGLISDEKKALKLKGRAGEVTVIRTSAGKPAPRIILVGTGKRPVSLDQIRQATAAAVKQARALRLRRLATPATGGRRLAPEAVAEAVAEGAALVDYKFDKYQQSEETRPEISFSVVAESGNAAINRGLARGQAAAAAAVLARDLVNEPPSEMTPRQLAASARRAARGSGLQVKVFGPAEMKRLGLNATLAVSRGSSEPAQFIRLRYTPPASRRSKRHVALVGKGVTFDSGGINIKPARGGSLEDMKMDMAGSAAVIATMSALRKAGVRHKVTAYLAATENLLGASAYKPGDVVRAFNGKSIEVGNTDAEGRLTLADALSYAVAKDKPDTIIDLATLTGAVIVALGHQYSALFANRDNLARALEKAAAETGEKLWRLPLPDEYKDLIKSPVADLHNAPAGAGAGTITAALFLQNFVKDTPWAHIDIAGPAWTDKDHGYLKRGGTGYGVRLLLHYLTQ